MEAVVYISHGSRSAEWNDQYIAFIEEQVMAEEIAPIVEYGFFELAQPSIGEAIATCVEKGATKVTVVPVLLLSGMHALIDIPGEILEAKEAFPHIRMFYAPVVGADRWIVQALVEKAEAEGFQQAAADTLLVVVHGSGHEETVQELTELTALVEEEVGDAAVKWGYLSRSPHYLPRLRECLLERPEGVVYIVPHFLAKGGFTAKIERQLDEEFSSPAEASLRARIRLCDPTGYHSSLAQILRERSKSERLPVIKQT